MIRPGDLVWRAAHQERRPTVEVRSHPKSILFKFTYLVAADVHTFEPEDHPDFQNARTLVTDFWRLIAEQDPSYDDENWTNESWKLSILAGALHCIVEILVQSDVEIDPSHVELGKKWLALHAEVL